MVIDRIDKQGLSDPLVKKIFQVDTKELPAFAGFYDLSGEYVVIKINKVITEDVDDQLSVDLYRDEYETAIKGAIQAAYVDDLKENSDIEINKRIFAVTQ